MSKLQRVILSICSSSCQTGPPVGEPITLPIMQQLANAVTCRRYIRHLYSSRPPLIIVLLSRPAKGPRVNRFCLPLKTAFHKPLHRFYVCVFWRNKKQVHNCNTWEHRLFDVKSATFQKDIRLFLLKNSSSHVRKFAASFYFYVFLRWQAFFTLLYSALTHGPTACRGELPTELSSVFELGKLYNLIKLTNTIVTIIVKNNSPSCENLCKYTYGAHCTKLTNHTLLSNKLRNNGWYK